MYKPLPEEFRWIEDRLKACDYHPRMVTWALAYYGLKETSGPGNTPEIMSWARELGPGVAQVYKADSVPWCGLFMAHVAKRAGKPLPASPLWARSWLSWGKPSLTPSFGDVAVFERGGTGGSSHVCLIMGTANFHYLCLGGNQLDGVNLAWKDKSSLLGVRCLYNDRPRNAVPVALNALGRPT